MEGQFDRLPSLMADFVRRRVAVIATPSGNLATLAAKAATTTIPIIFSVGEDPVKLGVVASLAHPGGNATGVNMMSQEVNVKRLGLLHERCPTWLVSPRWSIRPMPPSPRSRYATYRKLHASLDVSTRCGPPCRIARHIADYRYG